jgi:hypothetical protein
MNLRYSLIFLGLIACDKTSTAPRDSKPTATQSANVEQKADEKADEVATEIKEPSCPVQKELKALPYDSSSRQRVVQGLGTNCNGLAYVKACPVVSVAEPILSNKGKTIKFAEDSAMSLAEPESNSSKTTNTYYLEFKVLHDQTELSVSIADLKLTSPLYLNLMNREQFDSLANTRIDVATVSTMINTPLFKDKVILPAGSYSLILRSKKAELSGVTIVGSQEIEDLGVVRADTSDRIYGCN